jgi:hypothetical protein
MVFFSSVERDGSKQTKLVRHGSVEIFDAAYNLTVPNSRARHSSQTKLEQLHADHLFIPGIVVVLNYPYYAVRRHTMYVQYVLLIMNNEKFIATSI